VCPPARYRARPWSRWRERSRARSKAQARRRPEPGMAPARARASKLQGKGMNRAEKKQLLITWRPSVKEMSAIVNDSCYDLDELPMITIEYLADYPEFLPTLVEWQHGEWGHIRPGDTV